jgi:hypothetical protein
MQENSLEFRQPCRRPGISTGRNKREKIQEDRQDSSSLKVQRTDRIQAV